jgi:hypothetical protein
LHSEKYWQRQRPVQGGARAVSGRDKIEVLRQVLRIVTHPATIIAGVVSGLLFGFYLPKPGEVDVAVSSVTRTAPARKDAIEINDAILEVIAQPLLGFAVGILLSIPRCLLIGLRR